VTHLRRRALHTAQRLVSRARSVEVGDAVAAYGGTALTRRSSSRTRSLLFDDHEFESSVATQRLAVDKAERSQAAKQKAVSKTTEDGYVVESLRSLLAILSTIVKNWLRPPGSSAEPFTLTTKPNERQQRALTLLDVAIGA
jgi:hypothetical protein